MKKVIKKNGWQGNKMNQTNPWRKGISRLLAWTVLLMFRVTTQIFPPSQNANGVGEERKLLFVFTFPPNIITYMQRNIYCETLSSNLSIKEGERWPLALIAYYPQGSRRTLSFFSRLIVSDSVHSILPEPHHPAPTPSTPVIWLSWRWLVTSMYTVPCSMTSPHLSEQVEPTHPATPSSLCFPPMAPRAILSLFSASLVIPSQSLFPNLLMS